jgi:hypothetical protein
MVAHCEHYEHVPWHKLRWSTCPPGELFLKFLVSRTWTADSRSVQIAPCCVRVLSSLCMPALPGDRFRLQSLKILATINDHGHTPMSHVSALIGFTALRELDADHISMVASLTQLRSLKLGTANPSILRPCPAASVVTGSDRVVDAL